ncbi:hypothetical protein QR680_013504 [Steinernema hermaphroditum]|uniref:G-protein coupled receptors family 1 profile domain-containing protein n=1 Tax=Steinernema hermaphroditum TaxID=289476 RepID=A0AA39I7U3_9BILA|nr:hypothetical protein QR680_013504 [Steinernema hermaphroditum]
MMADYGSLEETALGAYDYTEDIRYQLMNATEEQRANLLLALRAKMEITDVLPPPNHEDLQVLIMAVAYMLLFLLGTCGNVAVLTTIYHVIRSRRANLDNTLIYVIVLSCVDFGVCLSLPFTVIDQILGFWMFGSVVCKLHAVLENFGKILSALILTAMSFDRYAGVCHPQKKWLRSSSLAVCILIGLAAYALVTLCPLLWSFTARELVLFEKETAPNKVTRMRIEKCTMVNISSTVFTMFTIYEFVLCYCVPLCLVIFFYATLLSRLRQHARQFKSSHIPLMRISLYTLAVACFYFLCWTPFWVATVFAVYLEYSGEQGDTVPPVFVYFMYFIHALPFTNSAVNWILYGALNGQLQHRYRGYKSEATTAYANGTAAHREAPSRHTLNNSDHRSKANAFADGPSTCLPLQRVDPPSTTVTTVNDVLSTARRVANAARPSGGAESSDEKTPLTQADHSMRFAETFNLGMDAKLFQAHEPTYL